MNACDDGKCPLNRQGVPHEAHELIESRSVKNPCNDPRCAMNRMGIRHDIHDEQQVGDKTGRENTSASSEHDFEDGTATDKIRDDVAADPPGHDSEDDHIESPNDALSELLKRIQRDRPSQSYKPPPGSMPKEETKTPRSQKPPQEAKAYDSEVRRILDSRDPHQTLGISKNATMHQIKTRYRELAKKYNPSQGIIHKSAPEKEQSSKIMARINHAYSRLRRMHGEGT